MMGLARLPQNWYQIPSWVFSVTLPLLSAAGPIAPGSNLLADPGLQACLDEALVANGWTTTEQVVSLECPGRGVSGLGGIHELPDLQTLKLPDNRISDLATLDLLDLLDLLDQLVVLDLANNRLTDILLPYPLQNLQELYLTGNRELSLAEVHPVITGNPGLTHLGLGGIALDDLGQLPVFTGSDAPYALVELDVSDAGLDDLYPVTQLETLQVLRAAGNRLVDSAPLDLLPELRVLDLGDDDLILIIRGALNPV